jgi:uncharacterized protein (DUF305 family)
MTRRNSVLRGLVAVVAVVALAAGLAGVASAEAPAPNQRHARFETDFMSETIDHHFLAVQMGELCVEKTTAPPPSSDTTLRQTCEQIVAAQSRQIELLQTWLADWYGIEKEPQLPPNGDQILDRLRDAKGEEFDTEVSKEFLKHHWTFLPEADRCTATAYHDELRDLCEQMYASQRQQVETFKMILNDHGVNRQGPNGNPGGR